MSESVTPLIDSWVIVDTGSTDGTQKIIREYLKDIPGNLYERPWVNFSHNRNEALELAKGKADYILFMDADDKLSFQSPVQTPRTDRRFLCDRLSIARSSVSFAAADQRQSQLALV